MLGPDGQILPTSDDGRARGGGLQEEMHEEMRGEPETGEGVGQDDGNAGGWAK